MCLPAARQCQQLPCPRRQLCLVETVEPVFYSQSQFGIALDGQSAIEKQCVGVDAACRQQQKDLAVAADDHIGGTCRCHRRQAAAVETQLQTFTKIIEPQGNAAAAQKIQIAVGNRLREYCLQQRCQ